MKIVRLQVRKRRDGIEMIDGACEGVTEGYRDTHTTGRYKERPCMNSERNPYGEERCEYVAT